MKQYIISPDEKKSITEQINALVEQGATWFTLATEGIEPARIADAISEAIGVCRPIEAILVVEGHPQLALETVVDDCRASGVIIDASHGDPAAIREQLGPHAIVGYAAASADEIVQLAPLDIDYFTLPATAMTPALMDIDTPIVATGTPTLPPGFDGLLVNPG